MRKSIVLFLTALLLPVGLTAQDDLYFTPKKKTAEEKNLQKVAVKAKELRSTVTATEDPAYYIGSSRDVDEYNRQGKFRSSFQTIGVDSLGNDVIEFHVGTGNYPDSLAVDTTFVFDDYAYGQAPTQVYDERYAADDDYVYTRLLTRWDGFYDPWFYGYARYSPFWHGYYPWYSGWYGGWYDPWYYGWYDPWYYGWGYPWYGGWHGGWWGYPHYTGWWGWRPPYGGSHYHDYGHGLGTINHGRPSYNTPRGTYTKHQSTYSHGSFGGSRMPAGTQTTNGSSRNGSATRTDRTVNRNGTVTTNGGNFGGSRSNVPSSTSSSSRSSSYDPPSRPSTAPSNNSSSGFGGGSFGGSRSGGGFGGSVGGGGGSRSGGGGFGGRR